MYHRNAHKSLKQIAAELGVGYVLEGSVRWEKAPGDSNRVRVALPELLHAGHDCGGSRAMAAARVGRDDQNFRDSGLMHCARRTLF